MPIVESSFRSAWWLPGPHLPTLWPTFFRQRPALELDRERLELADGDFLDLSWHGPRQHPVVLLLHGLEGSLHSHYTRPLLKALGEAGYRACLMHFRGCGGEPNRLPRSYHSGDSPELEQVAGLLQQKHGADLHAVVGFSLGGNLLLKWLGEQQAQAPVRRAVAVSVPFDLADAAQRLNEGFSRFYQRHLIGSLKQKYRQKFSRMPSPLQVDLDQIRSFRQFDHQITAPLHGFSGVDDYYRSSSSRQFLNRIAVPTLIIHDRDDPFMYTSTVPDETELSPNVILELTRGGGHVGFIQGRFPGRARYWLEQRVLVWLQTD